MIKKLIFGFLVNSFNALTLAILMGLSIYATIYHRGGKIANLFSDLFQQHLFSHGWLTGVSEIMRSIAISEAGTARSLFVC